MWEPLDGGATDAMPLPGRLRAGPDAGVVGRTAELAQLADAFKRVAGGDGREVVLVAGEAGLGKTTLVAEAARAAHDAGACVLLGHCEEDLVSPYQLFAESLGHYVTHATEEQLAAHVDAYGSELARIVPALASRLPGLAASKATDADTERYLLFAAAVGLLAAASGQQPVLLVLDDMQWADAASLQLLRHLSASDTAMRLLVLGTYRDSEVSHTHALRETLGVLRRHRGVTRLDLGGLDDTGVVSMMEAIAGHSLDEAAAGVAHAVYRETDGNPFFVSEVLRHLADIGAIALDASGRWVADDSLDHLALPDSVRDVIGGRVVRLGPDAERVLSVAAVIGRDFDLELLARASTTSEDELLDVLDAAASVALVREVVDAPGRYSFLHSLIQHTLYEDLGPTRRARVHRQVAEALEDLCRDHPGPRVGELARHWTAATQPIDVAKAVEYSRQAADAALASLAPDDALGYYAQAIALLGQGPEADPVLRLDLGIGLGTAQRQIGDPVSRDTLLGAAREAAALGDIDRLVAAALANDRGLASSIDAIDRDKVEVLEVALDRLPPSGTERALVLATLCQELTWGSPLEQRQALAGEALAIAQASGDDATIIRVANHVGDPLHIPSLLDESLARTADALRRAERLGDPVLLFFAAGYRAMIAPCSGDIAEMDRCIDIEAAIVDQLGQPTLTWVHTFTRTVRALIAGDVEEAGRCAADALRIGRDSGQPDADTFHLLQSMEVSWQRGTMGAETGHLERAIASYPGLPVLNAGLAVAHVEAGDLRAARRIVAGFAAEGFELPHEVGNWLPGMVLFAEAAIECEDVDAASVLYERLAPYAELLSCDDVTAEGPVSQFLGGLSHVLGRHDEADEHFANASAFCERVDAKFFAARTNLSWARALRARGGAGDAAQAHELVERALASATTNGYANLERRATATLLNLG